MKLDWEAVDEMSGGGYSDLPNGGYVCKVLAVFEVPNHVTNRGEKCTQFKVAWDVAEGEHADFFTANDKPDWTHEVEFLVLDDPDSVPGDRRWLFERWGKFLAAVKMSNDTSKVKDTRDLEGMLFGATVRHRLYTKKSGEDGSINEFQGYYSTDYIRDGKFREPTDRDQRQAAPPKQTANKGYDDAEIPF